jgi:hypothetical protein
MIKTKESIEMTNYAGYKIDGSKANDFRAEVAGMFDDAEFKAALQTAMINLDRETMSFELATPPGVNGKVLAIAKKYGTGVNSYA